MVDLLALPEAERDLLIWMLKTGAKDLNEIRAFLHLEGNAAQAFIASIIARGFLKTRQTQAGDQYLVSFPARPPRRAPSKMGNLLDE
jgi:hypothetical protein